MDGGGQGLHRHFYLFRNYNTARGPRHFLCGPKGRHATRQGRSQEYHGKTFTHICILDLVLVAHRLGYTRCFSESVSFFAVLIIPRFRLVG